jgi:hypothetical protein
MSQGYAELHCLSNFSFQRGASSAQELFTKAAALGYQALAITDECTMAGIVRAWQASQACSLALIVGSEMRIEEGPKLVLLAQDLAGYQALCRLITLARRRASKGQYRLLREDLDQVERGGLLALWIADEPYDLAHGHWLKGRFAERLWVAVQLHRGPDDRQRLQAMRTCTRGVGVPCRTRLQPSAITYRWPRPGMCCLPMANAICEPCHNWPISTRRRCWKKPCTSPGAARSTWASCVINTPVSWCPAVTMRVPGCAI